MTVRITLTAVALLVFVAGCSAGPAESPPEAPLETGTVSMVDEARSVASDLEQRTLDIGPDMRDPFSRP